MNKLKHYIMLFFVFGVILFVKVLSMCKANPSNYNIIATITIGIIILAVTITWTWIYKQVKRMEKRKNK